jgi:hypothetical protein
MSWDRDKVKAVGQIHSPNLNPIEGMKRVEIERMYCPQAYRKLYGPDHECFAGPYKLSMPAGQVSSVSCQVSSLNVSWEPDRVTEDSTDTRLTAHSLSVSYVLSER